MNEKLQDLVDKIQLDRLQRQLSRVPGKDTEFNQAMATLLGTCRIMFDTPNDSLFGLVCAVQGVSCLIAGADEELAEKIIDVACAAMKANWKRDGDAYGEALRQLETLQMMDGASKH